MEEKMMMNVAEKLNRFKNAYGDLPAGKESLEKATRAFRTAKELYSDMEIWLENDPLGMGAICLCIKGFDIVTTGEKEKALFSEMIKEASKYYLKHFPDVGSR